MRPLITLGLLLLATHLYAKDTPNTAEINALTQQAQEVVSSYGQALQKTLKANIMTSGPASAIKSCRIHAPGISRQTAALTGWQIRRTSNKVRNPANQPDSWEDKILANFAQQAANGVPVERLEHHEVREENGKKVFRYMKAIEVNNLCLNCHGTHVSGPVKEAIDGLFPTDQATGYRKGDLRGAFSLKKVL